MLQVFPLMYAAFRRYKARAQTVNEEDFSSLRDYLNGLVAMTTTMTAKQVSELLVLLIWNSGFSWGHRLLTDPGAE